MVLEIISLSGYEDSVLFIARLILGVIMIYYGWPKIKDLKKNASDFDKMGFPPGMFWGTIIALVEFVGGVALIIGVFVETAAALIAINMIVGTIWKITKVKKPFTDWSYDLLILAIALILLAYGAGTYILF